ncbi:MAG: hypothetical protein WD070_04945, partial [Pirellulaceae bacterium]
ECREVILAYALLRRRAGNGGWTEQELDAEAEAFLQAALGIPVDFEVADALQKLVRFRAAAVDEAGRWRASSLEDASAVLVEMLREASSS